MHTTYFTIMESPVGPLTLVSDGTALTGLYFASPRHAPKRSSEWVDDPECAPLPAARLQLQEYFAGKRRDFDLPLGAQGTAFQRRVWEALLGVRYGKTASYGQIAAELEKPNACRAVGLANGQNPISIIVPCHRVIGSNGNLTGYGGGLPNKEWLLKHESEHAGA